MDPKPFRIAAVLFDFDGTLTVPDTLDFAAVRRAVGCPPGMGLLEYLAGIGDAGERQAKEALLQAWEMEAAGRTRENAGAGELVRTLHELGVPLGIITRNTWESIDRSFAGLPDIDPGWFGVIVTRDLPLSPKPFPDGVHYAAERLGVDVAGLLVVGDYLFDIQAGKRAGALAMYLHNDPEAPFHGQGADFVVRSLAEALRVIRSGLPLPVGKLPGDLLSQALSEIAVTDPSVLVGAALGEDAAVLAIREDEVLVLASDPVTLAAESLSRYAVLVNANDVATSGATPRWFVATLLFPVGSTASEITALISGLQAVCAEHGIALCGGHTEITDAVTRPVVVGTMAGTVSAAPRRAGASASAPGVVSGEAAGRAAAGIIDKRGMREGDRILLTKGVAVEGTGLIAREHPGRLLAAGMSTVEVERCAAFLDRIGILEEAAIARAFAGVSALHDVTEGGLATALRELGAAGGRRLRLHLDRIPIYPETARICSALGLDPLGLIGSGSLLITCLPQDAAALAAAIEAAGIEIRDIGEVLDELAFSGGSAASGGSAGSGGHGGRAGSAAAQGGGPVDGIEALRDGAPARLPMFARDEVSRLAER